MVAVTDARPKGRGKRGGRPDKSKKQKTAKFLDWASQKNKHYVDVESMIKHADKFMDSAVKVEDLNKDARKKGKKGEVEYELNFFADLLDDELEQYRGNLDDSPITGGLAEWDEDTRGRLLADTPVNWSELGHLTPVKD